MFSVKSPNKISLSESEVIALNGLQSGFPSGHWMVAKMSIVLEKFELICQGFVIGHDNKIVVVIYFVQKDCSSFLTPSPITYFHIVTWKRKIHM